MRHPTNPLLPLFAASLLAVNLVGCGKPDKAAPPAKPALTVATVQPEEQSVASSFPAYGGVFAWQEASAGVETGGLRLLSLHAEVGDRVRKGQVLARLNPDTIRAELAAAQAALAEASASQDAALDSYARAQRLVPDAAISEQAYQQAMAAAQAAEARHAAASAQVAALRLRLAYTEVRAPDDGAVVARNGSIGQVVPAGTELFRIIRQNRIEWRAEVSAEKLATLRAGGEARLELGGKPLRGTIRKLSPGVETGSRTGLAYVDLPEGTALVPGQYLQGTFTGEASAALTLPATAVVTRAGKPTVLVVGADSRVAPRTVTVGPALVNGRVAVLAGVSAQDTVVESGGAFLADGDLVAVSEARK